MPLLLSFHSVYDSLPYNAMYYSNCDYTEEVEASFTSFLITVALEDSSLMDLKLKLIVGLSW